MRRFASPLALLLLLPGITAVTTDFLQAAENDPALKIGQQIGDFTLKDTEGKEWSLRGLKEPRAIVVLFLGAECPINNAYMPRLGELHKEFAAKGVQFLAINSNTQDTPDRVAAHARKHAIPFPVLKDPNAVVADLFGARRTPEAFVLDAQRKLRYQGRIDDQYGIGYSRPAPTRRDLALALEQVLAGKPVARATTEVPGCLIARPVKAKGEPSVTFARVSLILQDRCQECHRPGQIGPMALLTYEDASAWSETIREVIDQKRMPPWHADPKHGKFANDRSLPQEERELMLAWIDQGCPKGNEKNLPPREFPEGWRVGKPDAVFTMPVEAKVPAQAGRDGIPYQYYAVKTEFEEDRWIQAAEARPGNRSVVHHIIVYILKPGERRTRTPDGIGEGFLVGHAPGDLPAVFAPGTAKRLPKGASLVFQMHYTPNGRAQTDRSSVGLIFARQPPKYEVRTRSIAQRRFVIPPGDDNCKVESRSTFTEDAILYTLLPHMHLRGKSFEYRAVYPDGKEEILLLVPRYDFNWQSNYRLAKPMALPAGTRIECTAYYDNSEKNPNNPDPTKAVRWGDQTWEEMMIGFVDYVYTGKKVK
jgi:peroxiredoxin